MRILIITHHRSGGMSFLAWIARELSLESYHEPFESQNGQIIDKVLNGTHVVTKVFPENFEKYGVDSQSFISTFDKVIVHRRLDKLDVAISNAHFDEDIHFGAHDVYSLSDDWAIKNQDKVDRELRIIEELHKGLDKFEGIGISTTYENLFINKDDVKRVGDYLGMKEFNYLDVLDSKRRLRNGTIGMKDMKRI